MKKTNSNYNRRDFLKISSLAGGGILLSISWMAQAKAEALTSAPIQEMWQELNGFIQITPDNIVKIFSPNPEFGTNVLTSLPMLVAEELEADWEKVVVEQGNYDTPRFVRQFTGGSNAMAAAWIPLRTAGATARLMLLQAAANSWNVPVSELRAEKGFVYHDISQRKVSFGSLATAASKLPVLSDVKLKDPSTFQIVGNPQKNKVGKDLISGKPLFTLDYEQKGMLIAMVIHPPAFGMQLKSFDSKEALKMPGIKEVFAFDVYKEGYERGGFDTRAFNRLIAVVGKTTWDVLNARKKVVAQWELSPTKTETVVAWGRKSEETIPAGLESTEQHLKTMHEMQAKAAKVLRKDGNPEQAFANAKKVLERTYTAPFLAHNPMEPISCFAHITDEKAFFVAPIQIPDMMKQNILSNLYLKENQLEIQLARMGGGFGRRAYGHYIVEAGHISKHVKAPIKLIYTREDDMTNGVYRPSYLITYRAAIDENNQVTAIHVKGGGIPEGAIHENRFPAGAFENYLAEGWQIPSNITIGAFRAPGSNFNASAEQSFLDELAHTIGKDPIDFRIDLLKKAKANPVGNRNEYNADRYIGVLELVKQKAGWGKPEHAHKKRGVAAYFCHNSYAAQVVDLRMEKGELVIDQVTSALDCGYVVNPEGAKNMAEGAVVDGVGNALFGGLVFEKGKPTTVNLDTYKIIRQVEAPKKIDVHFVKSDEKPTGLGEPPFPPVFAAVANALFQATGKRFYDQPYLRNKS